MSIVLMRDFSALTFFRRGDAGERHSMLCRFISESYLKHQNSSSVTMQFKKFYITSTQFRQNPVKTLSVPASDRQPSVVTQDDNTFFSSLNSG
ncbi:hypothetical protein TNCV_4440171 [Trichonephila clavipes]|nr:hypothetical protein TNCV_4440171 [Trichonephila clavipes]